MVGATGPKSDYYEKIEANYYYYIIQYIYRACFWDAANALVQQSL